MGHAEHDLLHAEIAAALDDLLERRDQRLAAVETEPLGAGVADIQELLEAFRLDELVEDGALAFLGEGDLLVGTLDALLDPGLLDRIGDVHELDAERLAVGAVQYGDDLADGAELEAEHVVEEDLAVPIGFREAVMGRMQFLVVRARIDVERIELRMQVAAHAIGTDQHDGANGVAGRLLHVDLADLDALGFRLRLDLVADRLLDLGPVAVEGGDEFAVGVDRPVRLFPGRAVGRLLDSLLV